MGKQAEISVNVKTVYSRIDEILATAPKKIDEINYDAAYEMRNYIESHWSGFYPPASSPGNPPAVRSGRLNRSLRIVPHRRGKIIGYRLIAETPYSGYLEQGTEKMAERPFLKPAARAIMPKYKSQYKYAIRVTKK